MLGKNTKKEKKMRKKMTKKLRKTWLAPFPSKTTNNKCTFSSSCLSCPSSNQKLLLLSYSSSSFFYLRKDSKSWNLCMYTCIDHIIRYFEVYLTLPMWKFILEFVRYEYITSLHREKRWISEGTGGERGELAGRAVQKKSTYQRRTVPSSPPETMIGSRLWNRTAETLLVCPSRVCTHVFVW